MIKRVFNFTPCSATAGKPFENGPKCPLYLKTSKHLKSEGWQQMFYNTHKTGTGDLCSSKFKRVEKLENEEKPVLSMMEINIEGSSKICCLKAILWTYHPDNILKAIDHCCEHDIMNNIETFLAGTGGSRS